MKYVHKFRPIDFNQVAEFAADPAMPLTVSPEQWPGDRGGERGRLVATVLRAALAEQRRICLLAGADLPGTDDCLGRDLSQLTIVVNDPDRAAALHDRFGHMIVVETEETEAFLLHQARLAEGFDMIIAPDLVDQLSEIPLTAMIAAIAACLRPGGRVTLIAAQSKAGAGQSFADIAKLVENTAGCDALTGRICGGMLLMEMTYNA